MIIIYYIIIYFLKKKNNLNDEGEIWKIIIINEYNIYW